MDRWSRWREYPTKRAKTFRRIFTARIFIHLGTRFLWPSWTRVEESNFQIFFNGTRATSACRKQVAPIVLSASNWSILFLPFSLSLSLFLSISYSIPLFSLSKKNPGLLFLLSLLGPFDLVAVGQIVLSIGNSRVTPEPERELVDFLPNLVLRLLVSAKFYHQHRRVLLPFRFVSFRFVSFRFDDRKAIATRD